MYAYWFLVESIHFLLGSIGTLLQPQVVINSYCMYPRSPAAPQSLEMVNVLSAFYIQNFVLAVISASNVEFGHYYSYGLSFFYALCFVWDIVGIVKKGWDQYPRYRWLDTGIHVVAGLCNWYYYKNCLGQDLCFNA